MEYCDICKSKLFKDDQYVWGGQILCWNCLQLEIKKANKQRIDNERKRLKLWEDI